ncbi:MAG: hypothetical protein EBZ77_17470 [Chitinophagia bacterium]|nr:hypothetical protein [Chitinophagia bacterium]
MFCDVQKSTDAVPSCGEPSASALVLTDEIDRTAQIASPGVENEPDKLESLGSTMYVYWNGLRYCE